MANPVVVISINGYPADVTVLISRLLNGEKLSYMDVVSSLTPDVIRELMPYVGKIMALFGGGSVPVPTPTPIPVPTPTPTPTPLEPDEQPIPLDSMPDISSVDMAIELIDADWLGGEGSSRATPEEIAKIIAGDLDLPPNGVILFGAVIEPNTINPRLLDDKFAYHFVISGKQSGELAHIVVDRREIGENRFLKSVPNRWSNDNPDPNIRHYPGWQMMGKFQPFYGNAQAEDRWITYWLEVAGVKGKTHRISWRHHGLMKVNG